MFRGILFTCICALSSFVYGEVPSFCGLHKITPTEGANGYQLRTQGSHRCEGTYRTPVASDFEVIGFRYGPLSTAGASQLQLLSASKYYNGKEPFNLTARSLSPHIYYRMDGIARVGESFIWPLNEVVGNVQGLSDNIAVFGWSDSQKNMVYVPVAVSGTSQANPTLILTLRTGVDVETVLLRRHSDKEGKKEYIQKKFSARTPIEIKIPTWTPQINEKILVIDIFLKPRFDDTWLNEILYLAVDV